MVRQTGIDGRIITAGRYAGLVSMGSTSPPDNVSGQRRWTHHHRQKVHRTGIEEHITTARWYAEPAVVRYCHRRMVRWADGGKIPSPLALYWRR
jgi:hypothetical protein